MISLYIQIFPLTHSIYQKNYNLTFKIQVLVIYLNQIVVKILQMLVKKIKTLNKVHIQLINN